MATTSARPLVAGLLLLAAALVLVLLGAGLRGPLNPACAGARGYDAECFQLLPTLFFVLALPTAIAGGVLVALWQGRRAAEADEAEAEAKAKAETEARAEDAASREDHGTRGPGDP